MSLISPKISTLQALRRVQAQGMPAGSTTLETRPYDAKLADRFEREYQWLEKVDDTGVDWQRPREPGSFVYRTGAVVTFSADQDTKSATTTTRRGHKRTTRFQGSSPGEFQLLNVETQYGYLTKVEEVVHLQGQEPIRKQWKHQLTLAEKVVGEISYFSSELYQFLTTDYSEY